MKKSVIAIALVLVLAICAFAGCSVAKKDNTPSTTPGTSNVSSSNPSDEAKSMAKIILVLEDKTEIPYDIEIKEDATVREALADAKLIDEANQSSFLVETIDGHEAKMTDGVLWMICDENGKQISGTVDEIKVSKGQTIKMVYTVAPNFDD